MNRKKGTLIILILLALNLSVNGITVAFLYLVVFPLIPQIGQFAEIALQTLDSVSYGSLFKQTANYLSFIVPSIFAIVYSFPLILRYFWKETPLTESLQKRVISAPLNFALIGATGWIIGLGSNLAGLAITEEELNSLDVATMILSVLSIALTTFIYIYYAMEFLIARFVISDFISDNKISHLRTPFSNSVHFKFLMLFIATAGTPIILLSALILPGLENSHRLSLYMILLFLVLFVSIDVYILMSSFFRKQLKQMEKATAALRNSDYSQVIPLVSADEFGYLSESINQMGQELKEKEALRETFGRVVDPGVRDHLMNLSADPEGEKREVTILFTDIRSFTGISEKNSPETVVKMLNLYLQKITDIIQSNNGSVNKFIGDAVMAVFNAPIENLAHRESAITSARQILEQMKTLNAELELENLPQIEIGIGVHTGEAIAGTVGSRRRMEYTVIGDAVNVASRLESTNKSTGTKVLISEDSIVSSDSSLKKVGRIKVRGRELPIRVYTIQV